MFRKARIKPIGVASIGLKLNIIKPLNYFISHQIAVSEPKKLILGLTNND
jgi:hypothetical protein